MKRNYSDGIDNNIKFFVGDEIEHTPAYGMKTLFIVGLHDTQTINELLTEQNNKSNKPIEHIFFGANHSFNPFSPKEWKEWTDMIEFFLKKDYLCSLDIPIGVVETFHDSGLCEHDNFIPQIRVPIPYIQLWNYNTMIKIDDKDFKATNPGVWSHSLHNLMKRECFTDWSKYKKDEKIK